MQSVSKKGPKIQMKQPKKLVITQDTDNDYIVFIDGKGVYSGIVIDHVMEIVEEFLVNCKPSEEE